MHFKNKKGAIDDQRTAPSFSAAPWSPPSWVPGGYLRWEPPSKGPAETQNNPTKSAGNPPCPILHVPAPGTALVRACPSSGPSAVPAIHATPRSVTFAPAPTVPATGTFFVTRFGRFFSDGELDYTSRMPKLYLLLPLAWLVTSGQLSADPNNDLLRVHFVDVGQGDAIWIQGPAGECTADGLNIVIDGGPTSGKNNRLITYLETYKLEKDSMIDYAILTHPHDDHYPGMLDVLKNYRVKTIVDSGFPKTGPEFQKFVTAAKTEKVGGASAKFVELRKQPGFRFPACTGLRLSILYGDTDRPGLGSKNSRENNASTVLRLEYKSFSFLFVGDLEGKDRKEPGDTLKLGEKALLEKAAPEKLRATVLKVGHHGSETSSTLSLIRAVQPEVIVIQSGRKAFSGTFLPDRTVLARYKMELPAVTIVRTDEGDEAEGLDTKDDSDGDDIAIVTDGSSLRVRQAKVVGGKRRWVTVKTIKK